MNKIIILITLIAFSFSQNYENEFLSTLKKSYQSSTINDALLSTAIEEYENKNYDNAYESLIMAFRSTLENEDISYNRNDFLLFMALTEQKLHANLQISLSLAILEDGSIMDERISSEIKKLNFKL